VITETDDFRSPPGSLDADLLDFQRDLFILEDDSD